MEEKNYNKVTTLITTFAVVSIIFELTYMQYLSI